MKAARHFIAALPELRAGVENRHHYFHGRHSFFGVHVDRNAASVVFHRARTVGQQDDPYGMRVSRHRFVDGVVYRLVDELMETALRRVANIHARALPHRFQPAQNLDLLTSIVR